LRIIFDLLKAGNVEGRWSPVHPIALCYIPSKTQCFAILIIYLSCLDNLN